MNKDEANVYGIEKLIRNYFTQEKNIAPLKEYNFDQQYLGYYNISTSRFDIAEIRDYLYPFIKISQKENQIIAKAFSQEPIQMVLTHNNRGHYRTLSGYDRFYSFVKHKNKNHVKIGRDNYIQTNLLSAWSRILIPIIALITFVIGLFLIPISYIKIPKEKVKTIAGIYLSTLLAIVSFFMMMFFMLYPVIQNRVIELLGNKTIWSQGNFFCSILFISFSIISALLMFKNYKNLARSTKCILMICFASFIITIIYLGSCNMIGTRTWI